MAKNLAIYKASDSYLLENTSDNIILNQIHTEINNNIITVSIETEEEKELFLLGTLLLIAKDFGFPEVKTNDNYNLNFIAKHLNISKHYYEIALKFLRKIVAEKINLKYELLDNIIKTSNLPLPEGETSHITIIKQLSEYICQLQKTNIHKFFNFCYRFDLPEKYFNLYMNSCEDLALLFIAREMQRYSYKIYYS